MELYYRLTNLSKEAKLTVMFAGLKIVPNLSTVYWEKSFIMQDTNCVKQPKTLIGERSFLALMANL